MPRSAIGSSNFGVALLMTGVAAAVESLMCLFTTLLLLVSPDQTLRGYLSVCSVEPFNGKVHSRQISATELAFDETLIGRGGLKTRLICPKLDKTGVPKITVYRTREKQGTPEGWHLTRIFNF